MIELKPCPLCNGVASLEYDGARIGTISQSCIVVCLDCGCRVESNEQGDNCGKKWNYRYSEIQSKITILEAILKGRAYNDSVNDMYYKIADTITILKEELK